jgi:hypothetical protein
VNSRKPEEAKPRTIGPARGGRPGDGRALALAAPADDRGPAALAEAHFRWALDVARGFARRRPRLSDDIESAALLGLWRAALAFDPSRGPGFKAAAYRRVVGAVIDCLRMSRPLGYRGRPGRAPGGGGGPAVRHLSGARGERIGGLAVADGFALIPDDAPPVGWEAEYHDDVEAVARRLPGRRGALVRRLYLHADTATREAAGRAVGLHRTRADQIVGELPAMLEGSGVAAAMTPRPVGGGHAS